MIRRIAAKFVPVALNLYKVRDAKDAAGDFFRSVRKQKDQYQGIWIASADAKLLAAHQNYKSEKTWTQEVLATMDGALKAFGPVAERTPKWTDPLPFRGHGVRPDGGITLAVYNRYQFGGRIEGHGAIDSINLSDKEWQSFATGPLEEGKEWTVPESVARQFCRCLSPASDQSTMPRPNELNPAKITASVRTVENGRAYILFKGEFAAIHKHLFEAGKFSRHEAQLSGVGVYDTVSKQLESLTFIVNGTMHSFQPYDKDAVGVISGVEWRRERPAG